LSSSLNTKELLLSLQEIRAKKQISRVNSFFIGITIFYKGNKLC